MERQRRGVDGDRERAQRRSCRTERKKERMEECKEPADHLWDAVTNGTNVCVCVLE